MTEIEFCFDLEEKWLESVDIFCSQPAKMFISGIEMCQLKTGRWIIDFSEWFNFIIQIENDRVESYNRLRGISSLLSIPSVQISLPDLLLIIINDLPFLGNGFYEDIGQPDDSLLAKNFKFHYLNGAKAHKIVFQSSEIPQVTFHYNNGDVPVTKNEPIEYNRQEWIEIPFSQ